MKAFLFSTHVSYGGFTKILYKSFHSLRREIDNDAIYSND